MNLNQLYLFRIKISHFIKINQPVNFCKNHYLSFSILLFYLFDFNLAHSQNFIRTVYAIPETGISKSYTDTFGEDHDFIGNIIQLSNLSQDVVYDSVTKLMWQRSDGGEMSLEKAKLYCDTLKLNGYTDWRLPTPFEAITILNFEVKTPAIDQSYFKNTGAEYWYTSQLQLNDNSKVWVTNSGGGIGNHLLTETISNGGTKKFHARAVRNTWSDTIKTKFEKTATGYIIDHRSGYSWIVFPDSISIPWERALAFANTIQGKNCRIPNIKELQTLADYELVQPCFDKTLFPTTVNSKYWSSSTQNKLTTQAWYLDANYGITTYAEKSKNLNVAVICENNSLNSMGKSKYELTVFPNPSTNKISIRSSNEIQGMRLTLLDIEGAQIIEKDVRYNTINNYQIDVLLPILKNGIYILQVENTLSAQFEFYYIEIQNK